jgi:hypothetical protein
MWALATEQPPPGHTLEQAILTMAKATGAGLFQELRALC